MRSCVTTACLLAALTLVACGTGEATTGSGQSPDGAESPPTSSFAQEGPFAAIHWAEGAEPRFRPPDRPGPRKLVFRDLEVGSGPAARRGDEVAIYYAGAVYRTGQLRYGGTTQPFRLGSGGLGRAFEEGIAGMRAEGRREVIIPARLLGGTAAIDYVIVLETLKPA
jgi:peptidylprolyl isomerase